MDIAKLCLYIIGRNREGVNIGFSGSEQSGRIIQQPTKILEAGAGKWQREQAAMYFREGWRGW